MFGKIPITAFLLCLALTCQGSSAFHTTIQVGAVAFCQEQQNQIRMLPYASLTVLPLSQSKGTKVSKTVLQMWSGDDELQGPDRIKACFPYILPLLDGDQFGYYIYDRIPPLGYLDDILLGPLLNIFHSVPFLGILFFLALTLGTRNAEMNRGIRFNAQQAALIDVTLVFPELISSSFQEDPVPRALAEPCANFVYYFYMSMVIYSIYSNLRGKKPNQIPWISGYAELAAGPF